MNASMISATILSAVFAAGAVQAEQTTGRVSAVDPVAMTITLDNGTLFQAYDNSEHHMMLGGYAPGDTVTVEWAMSGTNHVATAISAEMTEPVSGQVKSVDLASKTVTLDNGKSYAFKGESAHVAGLKAGDHVSILGDSAGAGRAIEVHGNHAVVGVVQAIDRATNTVTLSDGTVYAFGGDVRIGGFKPGDAVNISASYVGGVHHGRSIASAG